MNDTPEPWGQKPHQSRPPWRSILLIVVAVTVGVAVVLGLIGRFPYVMEAGGSWAHLTYLLLLLVLLSLGFAWRRPNVPKLLRHGAIWMGVIVVIVLFYAYRFELSGVKDRLLGELVPGMGQVGAGGEIHFRAGGDGHFRLEALVNDAPVRFLLDTGASDIILDPADAVRLGFNLDQLDYSRRYRTANGVVKGAPVHLRSVRVGPIEVRDVRASVNGAPLGASLLGVSFLERLSGYSVENGTLTLRR
ncbi:MAG: TIGR02281 family clan AA aspartic protease [Rhodospirillaceae bacterium]|nr:TIGR02281 family clan AA aspartic protease [Rhodospirillaceae bacterium]